MSWDEEQANRVKFIEDCRTVVKLFGKISHRPSISGSVMDNRVRLYEDAVIRVVCATKMDSLAMDIELLAPIHNPVVMIRPDGTLLRMHGQYLDLVDHVERLLLLDHLAQAAE